MEETGWSRDNSWSSRGQSL